MNRSEAAWAIAEALEADYSAIVWQEGGHCRIYLTEITRKSRGRVVRRENGYVEIETDGTISVDHVGRQAGTIRGLIDGLELAIESAARTPRAAYVPDESPDDPLDRLEWEHDRVGTEERDV